MPPEILTFIGQAASAGGISAVAWFLLLEVRRELRGIAAAEDRLTRTILLLTLALNNISPRAAEQAKALLEEVTAAEKERLAKEQKRA